ncbi:MAG: hypothetical protein LBK83_01640 [Treponema sp.]|nr:hypothetical protein [Treponema sp.]
MIIEQIVEIPADHRLTIEVPPEIPVGRAILAFTPAETGEKTPLDRETAREEMNRIRKLVEGMDYQPPSCDITDSLKEAIRRASTEADVREYRRMLDLLPRIIEILDNDEGVRIQRKMRAEWDSPRDYTEPAAHHA